MYEGLRAHMCHVRYHLTPRYHKAMQVMRCSGRSSQHLCSREFGNLRNRQGKCRVVAQNSAAEEVVGSRSRSELRPHTWVWQGHKIEYISAGCGSETLVLVHGFGASWGHYKRIIPKLSSTYKIYALDLLGFGGSEKPQQDYSIDMWAQQVQDFLEEFAKDSKRIVLVGNSIGSLVSLLVAKECQNAVDAIVLLNTAGGMNNKAIGEDWRIQLVYPLLLVIDFLLMQKKIARYLFDNVRDKKNLKQILLPIYPSNPGAVDDELIDLLHMPSCDEGRI